MMEILTIFATKLKAGFIPALSSLVRDLWLVSKNNLPVKKWNILLMAFSAGFFAIVFNEVVPNGEWKSPIMFAFGFFIREIYSFMEGSKRALKHYAEAKRDKFLNFSEKKDEQD